MTSKLDKRYTALVEVSGRMFVITCNMNVHNYYIHTCTDINIFKWFVIGFVSFPNIFSWLTL